MRGGGGHQHNSDIATECDDHARQTLTVPRWSAFTQDSMCTSEQITHPEPGTMTERQHCGHKKETCATQVLLLSQTLTSTLKNCVKASAPSIDATSSNPTTPPSGRPTEEQEQDVSEDCAIVTKREYRTWAGNDTHQPEHVRDTGDVCDASRQQSFVAEKRESSNTTNVISQIPCCNL